MLGETAVSGFKAQRGRFILWTRDVHAMALASTLSAPHARKQVLQVTVRARGRGRWRWARLEASWPRRDLRQGRGLLAMEAKTWLTDGSMVGALGLKTFVRLKVGLGGTRDIDRKEHR